MLIERVRTRLVGATGLDLNRASVARAVRRRMAAVGESDGAAYLERLQQDRSELDLLIDEVVVPETWFFREPEAFAAAGAIVDSKREHRRPVRILCLPCASGEEPYSLAIALCERGLARGDYSIDAADISAAALRRAAQAVYPRNAFRTHDLAFRDRYFEERADGYHLQDAIREQVRFSRTNLLEPLLSDPNLRYDIVFCRNLLIYFDEATQRHAIARLQQLLRSDGVLFSGYAEAPSLCRHGFSLAPYPRAFALVRRQHPAQRPPAPMAAARLPVTASLRMHNPGLALAPGNTGAAPAALQKEDGNDADRLLQHARRLADDGQLAQAMHSFERYLRQVPDSAEAHFMLGVLHERMQEPAAAVECLKRAVYLDPAHYEALCHLALLQERHGERTLARTLRQRAERVYRRRAENGVQG